MVKQSFRQGPTHVHQIENLNTRLEKAKQIAKKRKIFPVYNKEEATERFRELARDSVGIEHGPRQSDRYGRLLAYVYTEDAESIAEKLIQEGLGRAWTQDGQHRNLLVKLEDEARKGGSGCLWGAASLPEAAGNCDPAYPAVCIPPPPPDLDCGEIGQANFQVLLPHPHEFDRDRDGVGCER